MGNFFKDLAPIAAPILSGSSNPYLSAAGGILGGGGGSGPVTINAPPPPPPPPYSPPTVIGATAPSMGWPFAATLLVAGVGVILLLERRVK